MSTEYIKLFDNINDCFTYTFLQFNEEPTNLKEKIIKAQYQLIHIDKPFESLQSLFYILSKNTKYKIIFYQVKINDTFCLVLKNHHSVCDGYSRLYVLLPKILDKHVSISTLKRPFKPSILSLNTILRKLSFLLQTNTNLSTELLRYNIRYTKIPLCICKHNARYESLSINNYLMLMFLKSYYTFFDNRVNLLMPCNIRVNHIDKLENKLAFPILTFTKQNIKNFQETISTHGLNVEDNNYYLLYKIGSYVKKLSPSLFHTITNKISNNIDIMFTNMRGYKNKNTISNNKITNIYHKSPVINSIPINISISSYNNVLNIFSEHHYKYNKCIEHFFKSIQQIT